MALSRITNDGVTGVSVDSNEVVSLDKSVIAKMSMSTATHDHAEQTLHRHTFDTVDLDSYASVANVAKTTGVQSGSGFLIPYAGFYKIYYQAHMGTTGGDANMRDTGIVISRFRSSTETVIGSQHNRHYDGSSDDSDVTICMTVIDDCQAGDEIVFHHYVNTDNNQAYDVYASLGEDDNSHMGFNSVPTPKASYCWIQRIT